MEKPFFRKMSEIPKKMMELDRGQQIPLVGPDTGAKTLDVHINLLAPGGTPGKYHYHKRSENVYIVLEGKLEVTVEGERFVLGPDDIGYVPAGLKHSASNVGDTIVKMIEIYSPPGPDFHLVDQD